MARAGRIFEWDVLCVGVAVVVSCALAVTLQLAERIGGWLRAQEGMELDEVLLSGAVGMIGLCLCLWRRTRALSRADRKRQASERRYQATFEQAAVGIALVAPDGRWLQVNQRLCDITGYSREELLQRTFQNITHSDDLKADMEHVRRLLAGEAETYSMEKRYIRKDGIEVYVKLTVRLIRKRSTEPDYFISVIEDITDRKQAEAELSRRAEELGILNRSMVGREGRMIELKREVNALAAELGREAPYPPVWEDPVAVVAQRPEDSPEP